ncbi:MAG: hypothetical protein FJ100_03895 [Deltaproteobacteria bacterium]|nr:hypothetical protein [Deltaproteobacteria bacterium]
MKLPPKNAAAVALFATVLARPGLATEATTAEPGAKPKLMIVPPSTLGEPKPAQERRVLKAAQDQLSASGVFDLVSDRDKVPDKVDPKKNAPKPSLSSKRIDAADAVRQEGINLQTEAKHADALDKLRNAVALYEKAYLELVNYSNLADAYMRAGVCAHYAGQGAGEATHWFELGIAIEPTLVIDRRKQDKALLELFDGLHARMQATAKYAIEVEVPAGANVEVFVDGVRLTAAPYRAQNLIPGTHYAQIRGEGLLPWGTVVRLGKKDGKVTAKIAEVKKEEKKVEAPLTIDALADCARVGAFTMPLCKAPAAKLGKQTGAGFLWFGLLRFDRFNRLSVVPFVMDLASGGTVQLKAVEVAPDFGDLNRKMTEHEAEVSAAVAQFPRARALSKTPAAFSGK